MIATSEKLIERETKASETAGLTNLLVNTEKTKVMVSSKEKQVISVYIDRQKLEQIQSFVYLGLTFHESGECNMDVRKRLAMGKSAVQSLNGI